MSHLAGLRRRRAPISPAVIITAIVSAITVTMAGVRDVFVEPAFAQEVAVIAEIDRAMENYRLDAHIPGMVWGIVQDGRLIHVKGAGVQALDTKRPVDADTLFRIASMTKAFTALSILKLRDEGKLALDAPAETYVPELREWKYPTSDSPKIRVRDLLTHIAGFVTDDPWGDRQTPMPEDDFTRLLRDGVPFTRPPAIAMEYSNLGYALLGRIIANVSARPYKDVVQQLLFTPLGMTSTGYDVEAAPAERRALGYRWEDNAWTLEPTMAHGAFGAMGGIQTSANDYAKWVAFLVSAWPPRDGADEGPVRRSSVRELAQGANFAAVRQRPGASGRGGVPSGLRVCDGLLSGGRLRARPDVESWRRIPRLWIACAAVAGLRRGHLRAGQPHLRGPSRAGVGCGDDALECGTFEAANVSSAPSPSLTTAYAAVVKMFTTGSVTSAGDVLAMNFLMDRDAAHWARDITGLKAAVGRCDTSTSVVQSAALSGSFTWRCEHGRINGRILLAPTRTPQIQALSFTRATP